MRKKQQYALLAEFISIVHLIYCFALIGVTVVIIVASYHYWLLCLLAGAFAVQTILRCRFDGCPLTLAEKHYRKLAGLKSYREPFLSNYLFRFSWWPKFMHGGRTDVLIGFVVVGTFLYACFVSF